MQRYGQGRTRPSAASSLVVSVFVVAVLLLAYLNEPLLVSRAQSYSFGSLAAQKKKKDKFR
ncbi:hypothetical protein BD311DRAFT_750493, partial [Dichomitus squalens]